jgi:hypothetical protein
MFGFQRRDHKDVCKVDGTEEGEEGSLKERERF